MPAHSFDYNCCRVVCGLTPSLDEHGRMILHAAVTYQYHVCTLRIELVSTQCCSMGCQRCSSMGRQRHCSVSFHSQRGLSGARPILRPRSGAVLTMHALHSWDADSSLTRLAIFQFTDQLLGCLGSSRQMRQNPTVSTVASVAPCRHFCTSCSAGQRDLCAVVLHVCHGLVV
jgi:hypothetical protein